MSTPDVSGAPTAVVGLQRSTFETSRLMEFFTAKELSMQIGHGRDWWPLALVKELVDNGLDACETAGVPPEVTVMVEDDAVSISDNGPGLPAETIKRSLDYLVRVSDKDHYVSPTRGQLGNALKCVYAAPYVASGDHGHVEILTADRRHQVTVGLDRIAQSPALNYKVSSDGLVKNGTLVKVHWPQIAGYLDPEYSDEDQCCEHSVEELVTNFAVFNPHASFTWQVGERSGTMPATNPGWRKWRPTDPTSPHWYTPERLRDLVAAYLTNDARDGARGRTLREFVAEFRGLSGTAKQKAVTASLGLTGAPLRDLVAGEDVDLDKVTALLEAMRRESRAPKPAALGVLGKEHMTKHMVGHRHVAADSVRYKKIEGEAGGLPFVLEVAFGIYTDACSEGGRDVTVGLNWSATLGAPVRELLGLLGEQRIDARDPVVILVHLACPLMQFTDRGKGVLQLLGGD